MISDHPTSMISAHPTFEISITILKELMWCWSSYLLLVPDLVRLQLNSPLQVGVVILNLVEELHWKTGNLQSVPLDIVPYIHKV